MIPVPVTSEPFKTGSFRRRVHRHHSRGQVFSGRSRGSPSPGALLQQPARKARLWRPFPVLPDPMYTSASVRIPAGADERRRSYPIMPPTSTASDIRSNISASSSAVNGNISKSPSFSLVPSLSWMGFGSQISGARCYTPGRRISCLLFSRDGRHERTGGPMMGRTRRRWRSA